METIQLACYMLAISLYVPLCYQILAGKVKQNMASWLLWAILDGIAAASILWQKGNGILPAVYAFGSFITAMIIIFRKRSFSWSWFETLVAVLVFACIAIWARSGPYLATIASTTAVVIASIPQIIEAIIKPQDSSFMIWMGYLTANLMSVYAGKEWSVIERLYPVACAALCLLLAVATSRKFQATHFMKKRSLITVLLAISVIIAVVFLVGLITDFIRPI